jgi:hypothetical protein
LSRTSSRRRGRRRRRVFTIRRDFWSGIGRHLLIVVFGFSKLFIDDVSDDSLISGRLVDGVNWSFLFVFVVEKVVLIRVVIRVFEIDGVVTALDDPVQDLQDGPQQA